MTKSRGKILIIRGGAIGDFILTLPVFSALRRQFPETYLEVLGYPHICQLALAGGLVDQVRSIEARSLAGFFARNGPLEPRLCAFFASFSLIISFLYDPDEVFYENIRGCSKAQFIAGSHRPDERENIHATAVFLKPLERLAIYDADAIPRLDLTEPGQSGLPEGNWLALHPGSGSESKNWPEDKWSALIAYLAQKTELKLLLVGGEAEGERLARLWKRIPPERARLALHLPLSELARSLRDCIGFIGHDSGISHLAAAVGVPSLILWGPTNQVVWRPRSAATEILSDSSDLSALALERVIERTKELFIHQNRQ